MAQKAHTTFFRLRGRARERPFGPSCPQRRLVTRCRGPPEPCLLSIIGNVPGPIGAASFYDQTGDTPRSLLHRSQYLVGHVCSRAARGTLYDMSCPASSFRALSLSPTTPFSESRTIHPCVALFFPIPLVCRFSPPVACLSTR